MSNGESLEALTRRVAALEERLGVESGLRASGDRDLSDVMQVLQAQRHLIQAISITQSEHTTKFERVEARLDLIVRLLTQLIDGEATP
jgi:hypothetical protein